MKTLLVSGGHPEISCGLLYVYNLHYLNKNTFICEFTRRAPRDFQLDLAENYILFCIALVRKYLTQRSAVNFN